MKFARASKWLSSEQEYPPAMQEMHEMWVRSLDQEDPLEEYLETHSSILTGKVSWREELGGLWSMGLQKVRLNSKSCLNCGN